jgi:L-threonylcarbamoyladenylate synthase
MKILKANDANIRIAAEIIRKGGLVAFPTETVYGLGGDGLNPIAVAKIFEAKNRPSFNPLILHIAEKEDIERIAEVENEIVGQLIDKFWPGPLTLVLKKKDIVPEIITAGHKTVAVRMPANEIARKLIRFSECFIAAPSANAFGFLSPTRAEHVAKQLGDKIDLILDGGSTNVGIESTILEITENAVFLLRPGGLATEEIESITGKLERKQNEAAPNSPGQLPYHYSPKVPLRFFDEVSEKEIAGKKIGALFFSRKHEEIKTDVAKILSPQGDLREAAANLFAMLHELENAGVEIILAEKVPMRGLGIAIMDRLKKASKRF